MHAGGLLRQQRGHRGARPAVPVPVRDQPAAHRPGVIRGEAAAGGQAVPGRRRGQRCPFQCQATQRTGAEAESEHPDVAAGRASTTPPPRGGTGGPPTSGCRPSAAPCGGPGGSPGRGPGRCARRHLRHAARVTSRRCHWPGTPPGCQPRPCQLPGGGPAVPPNWIALERPPAGRAGGGDRAEDGELGPETASARSRQPPDVRPDRGGHRGTARRGHPAGRRAHPRTPAQPPSATRHRVLPPGVKAGKDTHLPIPSQQESGGG